jgi:hypothetical protein
MSQAGGGLGRDETAEEGVTRISDRLEEVLQGDYAVFGQTVAEGG